MEPESSDFISFTCSCGQRIQVPARSAGAKGRCKACGRRIIIPVPLQHEETEIPAVPPDYTPPVAQQGEKFSEEDLMTYPSRRLVTEKQPPVDALREKPTLFHMLGDILRYPVSDKLATQIFLTGAIFFSPLMWKTMYVAQFLPCIGFIFVFLTIVSIRLMYFSYLLLIIEKSAEGRRKIPELPVFQTWEQNLNDLVKVIGASVIAFAPYLVYAFSSNVEMIGRLWESAARGEPPEADLMSGASSTLGMLLLLYAIAAFYMPMVLMSLVVTKKFLRAVNPLFIVRSILRIGREYLVAMLIIFLFLRGALTLFTIVKDVLDADWFTSFAANVGEPIIEFYVLVVTMHVIGLLYYRNGDKLCW